MIAHEHNVNLILDLMT